MMQLKPVTPLVASSTVVNLLLATGPFTYPYSYVGLGPILSSIIMFFTCFLAYVTATYMVEAISLATSAKTIEPEKIKGRHDSLFNEACYKTPEMSRRQNDVDGEEKESEFYIREKLELGVIADRIAAPWVKYTIMFILVVYMYGAMALKYVAGAESLYEGISFLAYGDPYKLEEDWAGVYYIGILIFGALSIAFSFGDIENSMWL
jgi:hypothetical protein